MELSPVSDGETYDTGQILIYEPPGSSATMSCGFIIWASVTASLSVEDALNRRYLDASALCLARLRMDGFVSLKGGIEWGSVRTRPLQVSGETLHVNTDSWRGRVLTEVIDAGNGQPIVGYTKDDCIPAIIDSIDECVQWRGGRSLKELVGQTVCLRFHLWQAELYSYWFD